MKRRFQRFTVFALSAAIFTGSFVTVYATESEVSRPAATESEVSKPVATESQPVPDEELEKEGGEEIAQVVLPTSAVDIFDFILDPQELIRQTNGAAYGGKTFEDGATLFFERFDGKAEENYTSDSDGVTITNRGSRPVDVEVNASVSVTMGEDLVMTEDREFTDDTRASLYLALTDGETIAPISLEEGASIRTTLPVMEEVTDEEKEYAFWLTGACNKNGDWSSLKDMEIKVSVTWNVVPVEEEPEPVEEENLQKEEDLATPSTVPLDDSGAASPEATASEVEKGREETREMPSKATPSDADKGVSEESQRATPSDAEKKASEEPQKATSGDVQKEIKKVTPVNKTAD